MLLRYCSNPLLSKIAYDTRWSYFLSWLLTLKVPEPWMPTNAEKPPEYTLTSVDSLTAFAKVLKLHLCQINQLVYLVEWAIATHTMYKSVLEMYIL